MVRVGLVLARVMAAVFLAAILPGSTALAQPPAAPPVGQERTDILAAIHKDYPSASDRIAGLMADTRQRVDDDMPCEIADWLKRPDSGATLQITRRARGYSTICALPIGGIDATTAATRLKDRDFAFDVGDGEITILARSSASAVAVCCSLQVAMTRIGTSDYWAARRRLPAGDRALLSLFVMDRAQQMMPQATTFRGPKAPAAPRQLARKDMQGRTLFLEIASAALGETRKLVVYLPPGWSKEKTWPAVFLTDGGAGGFAPLVEAMIRDGQIRPMVLVSAVSAPQGIVGPAPTGFKADLRSVEYIRNFRGGGERFDRHMVFFAEELPLYAAREFGVSTRREDRAVAGYSNGGVFALWAGLLHPEVFSMAVPMSPGVAPISADDLRPGPRARFWMAGGLYEPPYFQTASEAEAVLKAGGYEVSGRYLAAGHFADQWDLVLHDALLQMFPAAPPVEVAASR